MSSAELMKMQQQLEEISASVNILGRSTRWLTHPDMVVQANLAHVWDVTQDLQRRVAHPAVVGGLCREALDQVARVSDLITECEGVPDGQQLTSIGFACELAAEKIKLYQQLSRHAAQMRASNGEGVKEAA